MDKAELRASRWSPALQPASRPHAPGLAPLPDSPVPPLAAGEHRREGEEAHPAVCH